MKIENSFLLKVGKEARKKRVLFWDNYHYSIRISSRFEKVEGGLWFKTKGCSYDYQGGCLMCDYSIGSYTTPKQMLEYVKEGLNDKKLENVVCEQLLVSPSGSMLDSKEVPREALIDILNLIKESKHKKFSFETRMDSINEEVIAVCKDILGNRFYRLLIGLETANQWIEKYCINKNLDVSCLPKTIKLLHKYGVKVAVNIIVSVPFLSVKENIEMSIKGIKWVISQGADEVFLFPLHVKKDTPLSCLYHNNLFEESSLWLLVEIMKRLGKQICEKYIRLSWYTSYGAYNIEASPSTCEKCSSQVINLLDEFADKGDYKYIEELDSIQCECKRKWYEKVEHECIVPLEERVLQGYKLLGKKFLNNSYCLNQLSEIKKHIYKEAEEFLYKSDINDVILQVGDKSERI